MRPADAALDHAYVVARDTVSPCQNVPVLFGGEDGSDIFLCEMGARVLLSSHEPVPVSGILKLVFLRSQQEMLRIHAARIAASVTDNKSFRNGANVKDIGRAVSANVLTVGPSHDPVPGMRLGRLPFPAFVLATAGDFLIEALTYSV